MPAWENCAAHHPAFVVVAVDVSTTWLLYLVLATRNSPSDGDLALDFGWVLVLEAAKSLMNVAAFQLDIHVFNQDHALWVAWQTAFLFARVGAS